MSRFKSELIPAIVAFGVLTSCENLQSLPNTTPANIIREVREYQKKPSDTTICTYDQLELLDKTNSLYDPQSPCSDADIDLFKRNVARFKQIKQAPEID